MSTSHWLLALLFGLIAVGTLAVVGATRWTTGHQPEEEEEEEETAIKRGTATPLGGFAR